MKIIASTIALLVMFLSVQPVCSVAQPQKLVEACCSGESDDGCSDEEGEAPADEDGNCKHCNPFQSCSCCAVAVVIPGGFYSSIDQVLISSIDRHWGNVDSHLYSNCLSGFWQPPRQA